LGALARASGSPRITGPAYQERSTGRRLHSSPPGGKGPGGGPSPRRRSRARLANGLAGGAGPGATPVQSLRIGRGRFAPEASSHRLYRAKLGGPSRGAAAILGETSGGTSYQTARLVFRTFAHFRRAIRTSAPLRTSTRVSPSFILRRHSSLSFGSQRACSNSIHLLI